MYTAHFDAQQRFILTQYDSARPFSSFLPGVAGPLGVPLWVFYVNRGQAIASFGVQSKDQPIVEFQPANKAYQLAPYLGFRTFLKLGSQLYEPFAPSLTPPERQMFVGMNELELQEINPAIGLQTNIVYFTVPQENFAGLVRQVTLQNISDKPLHFELLDGLPTITPYGVNNALLKDMSRTLEAWMEVFNLAQRLPFYRVRASVIDRAEVEVIEAGHFALAFIERSVHADQLPVIVDPTLVFGQNTALSTPASFCTAPLASLVAAQQITTGRTPCAFFGATLDLLPGEALTLHSVYGHVSHSTALPAVRGRLMSAARLSEMRASANILTQQLTDVIDTHTADPIFDAYCRQTFLDNVLRGGWPVVWGDNVYHLYSRKHGDLERDYNAFELAAEFYSQGNGAYRDINQNRRSDVLFQPRVGDFNIRAFMSLIQADGYNPLVIQGSTFTLPAEQRAHFLAQAAASGYKSDSRLAAILSQPFTPGQLLKFMLDDDLQLSVPPEEFLERVMRAAGQQLEARFGEGYWIDHWTYNLDLIESYLAIYPDRKQALLFESALPFFDSAAYVQPRCRKYVLANGHARQFNAVLVDEAQAALIASREVERNWLRLAGGRGAVYRTTLFNKLVMLAIVKFATLDPCGMGIEMEAGKPGWYDALNGLPGLFGSSLNETFELLRLVQFLQSVDLPASILLPGEIVTLLHEVIVQLQVLNSSSDAQRDFHYWDAVSTVREEYRASLHAGLSGEMETTSRSELAQMLSMFAEKLQGGIRQAIDLNDGLPPAYFTYHVEDYELIRDAAGQPQCDRQGRPYIRIKRFTLQVLPLFLEGLVHAFKVTNRAGAAHLYQQVKASPLFDRELQMYKVNASLADQPHDIGRARAFLPGWLENESIWLHMEYKYLLEVLRAGLYEEFFEDCRSTLIPFLDPEVYGRSPLENSSFLVSSAHPDRSLHGAGFVARLSGSTAEFLSLWQLLFYGPHPFLQKDGELQLKLQPALPGWLFPEHGAITFKFLGQCLVTYHNPQRLNTFDAGARIRRMVLFDQAGKQIEMAGDTIGAPWAARIRSGEVGRLDLYLE